MKMTFVNDYTDYLISDEVIVYFPDFIEKVLTYVKLCVKLKKK